jgi:hypothetical protein
MSARTTGQFSAKFAAVSSRRAAIGLGGATPVARFRGGVSPGLHRLQEFLRPELLNPSKQTRYTIEAGRDAASELAPWNTAKASLLKALNSRSVKARRNAGISAATLS